MIGTYEAFAGRVRENGFMTFTDNPWGSASLEREVAGSVWGDTLPDPPWSWKNRIAARQEALYGHVLGGRLTFVAPEWIPIFFAAARPERDIRERYEDGAVDNLSLRVIDELRTLPCMAAYQLRAALGMQGKQKGKLDGALRRLEREMYVSIGASVHKINKRGEPYGWGVNEYWLCEAFYPPYLEAAREIGPEDARERIFARMREQGGDPSAQRVFGAMM